MMFYMRKTTGFTLPELLIVAVIIAIAAAAAIPFLSDNMEQKADLEVNRIKSTIMHARALALSRREAFQVSFNPKNGLVSLVQKSTFMTPSGISDGSWSLKYGEFTGVDFNSGSTLEFDSSGDAVYGGTITMAFGDLNLVMSVAQKTGCVTVDEVPVEDPKLEPPPIIILEK